MLRPTSLRSFVVRMRNVYRLGHAGDVLISGVSCGSPVNTSMTPTHTHGAARRVSTGRGRQPQPGVLITTVLEAMGGEDRST